MYQLIHSTHSTNKETLNEGQTPLQVIHSSQNLPTVLIQRIEEDTTLTKDKIAGSNVSLIRRYTSV